MEPWDYFRSILLRLPGDAGDFFEVKAWIYTAIGLAIAYAITKWKPDEWKMKEVKGEAWNILIATLSLCGVILLFLVFVYSPYQQYKEIYSSNQTAQGEVKKLQKPVVKDERSETVVADLRQQVYERDREIQELKRRNDRTENSANLAVLENATLKSQVRDLQGKVDDKAARNALKGKLLNYLHGAQFIQQNCVAGLKDSPTKEYTEWHQQTIRDLKTLDDASYLTRFTGTPPPNDHSYEFRGKPVSNECNRIISLLETKQAVLNNFIAELNR